MKKADIPTNEKQRLQALYDYDILDSLPEKDYDAFTHLAAQICEVPIALINLTDAKRQWIKSSYGYDFGDTTHLRENSICAHAVNAPTKPLVIHDCRQDERFCDNPYVVAEPPIVFYAGVPLVTPEGYALGTLCAIDSKPKKLRDDQLEALKMLGQQIVNLMELRKKNKELEVMKLALKEKNQELEEFVYVVSHDIKSPLNSIEALAQMLKLQIECELKDEDREALSYLEQSAVKVKKLVTDILAFYKGDQLLTHQTEAFSLQEFCQTIIGMLDQQEEFEFNLPSEDCQLEINKTALKQIFINLISNSIKYNYSEKCIISIGFEQDADFYYFTIKDNGSGIPPENLDKMFNLFTNLGQKDRKGELGTGIGLATVKKLVDKMEGDIKVNSKLNEGTEFWFSVRKAQEEEKRAA